MLQKPSHPRALLALITRFLMAVGGLGEGSATLCEGQGFWHRSEEKQNQTQTGFCLWLPNSFLQIRRVVNSGQACGMFLQLLKRLPCHSTRVLKVKKWARKTSCSFACPCACVEGGMKQVVMELVAVLMLDALPWQEEWGTSPCAPSPSFCIIPWMMGLMILKVFSHLAGSIPAVFDLGHAQASEAPLKSQM